MKAHDTSKAPRGKPPRMPIEVANLLTEIHLLGERAVEQLAAWESQCWVLLDIQTPPPAHKRAKREIVSICTTTRRVAAFGQGKLELSGIVLRKKCFFCTSSFTFGTWHAVAHPCNSSTNFYARHVMETLKDCRAYCLHSMESTREESIDLSMADYISRLPEVKPPRFPLIPARATDLRHTKRLLVHMLCNCL